MLPLITLILSLATLHFGAGGKLPEAIYAVGLIVNLTAFIELIKALRENRLSDLKLTITCLCLFSCVAFYFLSPGGLISSQKSQIFIEAQEILNLGYKQNLYQLQDDQFSNSLNFWGSLKFLLVLLILPATVYLTAILEHRHKMQLCFWMLSFAGINIIATFIDKYLRSSKGVFWGTWDLGNPYTHGAFVNPNHYGIYITSFLPLLIIHIIRAINEKNVKLVALHSLLISFFVAGIMLSDSRGAYAVSGLTLIFSFVLLQKSKSKHAGIIKFSSFLFVMILFSILSPSNLENEFKQDEFKTGREQIFEVVPQIITDFPDGLGPQAYRFNSPSYIISSRNSMTYYEHSENTFFQFALENSTLFLIILIALNLLYLNKLLDNMQKGKVSSRLSFFSIISLSVFILHAVYDYGFQVPLYGFSVALCYGLSLTKGSTYSLERHKTSHLHLSRAVIFLPLICLGTVLYIKNTYGRDFYVAQGRYETSKNSSIEELAQNIYRTPTCWHNWYFLGAHTLKKDNPEYLSFVEACYKNAALNFANNANLWLDLAYVRYYNKNKSGAKASFRRYFLLQSPNQRQKLLSQARIYGLTETEIEYLLHLELPEPEKRREFIREL